jgi:glycine cleavage system H protein
MHLPADLKYTDTHEWLRQEGDGTVAVGITWHAQDRLGDLVYVENPVRGKVLRKGEECGVVESVKAAADIYAPISGEVVAVNEDLAKSPERINQDPYSSWMFKVMPSDPSELQTLLNAAAYEKLIESESH